VTGNGTTEEAFWPTGTDGNLTLGGITSPLEAHKSKLIFTRGVDMRVWSEDNPFGGNGDAHHNWGAVLTATKAGNRRRAARSGRPWAGAGLVGVDRHSSRQRAR